MARPLLDEIELQHVQHIDVEDSDVAVPHAVPALEGDFIQRLNRRAVRASLTGVLTGPDARDKLRTLREKFRAAVPVTFVADATTATRVGDVLIKDLEVTELAGKPERFEYALTLREFIPPPPVSEEPPPEIETPESPADQIDQGVGTLILEVTAPDRPDFDFGRATVSARGTLEDGTSITRTLSNREQNVWTEEDFPRGEFTIEATASSSATTTGSVLANVQPGATATAQISLRTGSVVAKTFIVHYHYDSAFVEPCMRKVLKQVDRYATDHPNEKLLIVGHTDRAGSSAYNQSLSERRARGVFAFLTVGTNETASLREWNELRRTRPIGQTIALKDSWGRREYQHILQDHQERFYPGNVDGEDGPLTRDAVRAYRCFKGLPAGTDVDDEVWEELIDDYLKKQSLGLSTSRFLPNCPGEILKWLGCGEEDPRDRKGTAHRPSRRTELLFVETDRLPCKVPKPDTFDLPAPGGLVNADWCLGPGSSTSHGCFVSPHLIPGTNHPQPCPTDPAGPWCRQPAQGGTITVRVAIQQEQPDGTLQPAVNQKFVLITPSGEFKKGEQSGGDPVPDRTTGSSDPNPGTAEYPDSPLGVYELRVITSDANPALVRLLESSDETVAGNTVCKVLTAADGDLNVVIINAPMMREIRLPVVAHLMTALHPVTRKIRTCPDAGGGSPKEQRTALSDPQVRDAFVGANRIWRQGRVRFQLTDIVRETYAFRTECEIDKSEFTILLERCAYRDAVNIFFVGDLAGNGEAGFGVSAESGAAAGIEGGGAVGDRFQTTILGPPLSVNLDDDQRAQVLAHELAHYLNVDHVDDPDAPANADRLMLPGSSSPDNTSLIIDEVNTARTSRGANDDCVPLTLRVSGATQIGGSLSHIHLIIQDPAASVTIDADIPDRLVDPAVGTLVMTGGDPGANDRQRVVSGATKGVVPVVATYTSAGGGSPVTAQVEIRVVTLTLEVDGATRVGDATSTTFLAVADDSQVLTVRAGIDPAPFCVPSDLVSWNGGTPADDPLRRTLSRVHPTQATITATMAGVTREIHLVVFKIEISKIDVITVGTTVSVNVQLDPSPLPAGVSITLELQTTGGAGSARFPGNNAIQRSISQTTTVEIQGLTVSDLHDNIRLTAKITGQTEVIAEERFYVGCNVFLPAISSPEYTDFVQPMKLGLVRPLINGRSSGGIGPDVDLTEPLNEMESIVKSLGSGDSVYLAAWFFEPATKLLTGSFLGADNWGELFAKKATQGVKVRIIINDFDPISKLDIWLRDSSLIPLDGIISSIPTALRDNMKYIVSMHPAHVGFFKSLVAGQGGRPINIASHHQKFMVARRADETFAFCGGLDIESRKTPNKWRYLTFVNGVVRRGLIGWHDIHVALEGPITHDLEKQFVMRWNRERDQSTRSPLPGWSGLESLAVRPLSAADNAPAKKTHRVQMLRTISSNATFSPYSTDRDDIRQVYRRAIGCASRFLYFENQYFRDPSLADAVVARGQSNPNLIVIMVVVASAAADDGANAVTEHGNHLQFETFKRIVDGLGNARVRLYSMKNRAVHSKFLLVDDMWMTIGSANANVRGFELDSELNVSIQDPPLTKDFRTRLWAHNLGASESDVSGWSVGEFFAKWDAVASTNESRASTLPLERLIGEGVIPFDHTTSPGVQHGSIPDAIAELDLAPDGGIFADKIPPDQETPILA